MPEGKRNGSKSDILQMDSCNFTFNNVGEYDAETTLDAARRACCFNFNNMIHSAQLTTKAMESSKPDVEDCGALKRARCNSGDSDLIVLSVILNKKQKENDEVALAIERLRENGVNCVIFTMNEIRNGNMKSDVVPNCQCFPSPKIKSLQSSCSCNPPNSELITPIPPATVPHNTNTELETPRGLLINLSPTPSPSPPLAQPASPMESINPSLDECVSAPTTMVKKKQRRKRKYPYATRKPVRTKKLKVVNEVKDIPSTDLSDPDKVKDVPEPPMFDSFTTPHSQGDGETGMEDVNSLPPLQSNAVELEQSEGSIKIESSSLQGTKKKGRKSRGERFEEAFQIAVQSFVETTKEKHHRTRNHCIPGVGRSMYTRSTANAIVIPDSPPTKLELPVSAKNSKANKVKRGRPKKMNQPTNVKAICIRNIFIGSSAVSQPEVVQCEKNDRATQNDDINESPQISSIEYSNDSTQQDDKNNPANQPTERLNSEDEKKFKKMENEILFVSHNFNSKECLTDNMKSSENNCQEQVTCGKHNPPHTQASPPANNPNPKDLPLLNGFSKESTKDNYLQKEGSDAAEPGSKISNYIIKDKIDVTELKEPCNEQRRCKREYSPDITFRTRRMTKSKPNAREKDVITKDRGNIAPDSPQPHFDIPREVKEAVDALISSVVFCTEMELTLPEARVGEWDDMPDIRKQYNSQSMLVERELKDEPPVLTLEVKVESDNHQEAQTAKEVIVTKGCEDSLPDIPDSMQLRRSSFYSLVTGNVRVNLENYLDGRVVNSKPSKRKRKVKNGFLLHHGDNCPERPESPYKLHLATQVLLKLNRRRSKCKQKEERTKTVLSYLKLAPRRSMRGGKVYDKKQYDLKPEPDQEPTFSGEWSLAKKYVCGVCGQPENCFWDMVTHKGEHPGVVVTHVELPPSQETPASLIRKIPEISTNGTKLPACTKCSTSFSSLSDLHSHIFDCAGNVSWLVEKTQVKRKGRRRGFKRRFSNTPKKQKRVEPTTTSKRRTSDTHKCLFCTREFKTEGWLKNHMSSHSLPVSIPLDKLPLASLPVRACFKRSTNSSHHLRNSSQHK